jgi:hypothetical protein
MVHLLATEPHYAAVLARVQHDDAHLEAQGEETLDQLAVRYGEQIPHGAPPALAEASLDDGHDGHDGHVAQADHPEQRDTPGHDSGAHEAVVGE